MKNVPHVATWFTLVSLASLASTVGFASSSPLTLASCMVPEGTFLKTVADSPAIQGPTSVSILASDSNYKIDGGVFARFNFKSPNLLNEKSVVIGVFGFNTLTWPSPLLSASSQRTLQQDAEGGEGYEIDNGNDTLMGITHSTASGKYYFWMKDPVASSYGFQAVTTPIEITCSNWAFPKL